ncbi:hypothetical protein AVL59_22415 [Streptomyces griseochromogenes]|uniref:Uncharacterized protein n=2 Tax=Streptomyces griseochromogenes TaxID=68214 RepID=A0A1B1AZI0_9ACTN|nr:hypothetical protein [Streptomyces griseochromogenes]ANP51957.1 hypothetical protein AVL59_22415 [Streptomyces griseochromogenes]
MASSPPRFRDPGREPYAFLVDAVLVHCPGCGGQARIARLSSETYWWSPRRLTCAGCGLSRMNHGKVLSFAGRVAEPTDPWFGLPLLLKARTRHGYVWAYNHEHLTLIQRFVQATLRERAPWYDMNAKMTALARLPRWMVKAGNRDEILRAISRAATAR